MGHPILALYFMPKNSSCLIWKYLDNTILRIICERYIPKVKEETFVMTLMALLEN